MSVVGREVVIDGRSAAFGGVADDEAAKAPTVIAPRSAAAKIMGRVMTCIG
jgi:hypothetical protein